MNHYQINIYNNNKYLTARDCITDLTLDLDELNDKLQSTDSITREMTLIYLTDISTLKESMEVNSILTYFMRHCKATIELKSII